MDLDVDLISEMRTWLADCTWADLASDDIAQLTNSEVCAAIQQHYSGGITQFLLDACLT